VEGSTSPIQEQQLIQEQQGGSKHQRKKQGGQERKKDGDQYKSLLERLGHERRSRKRHHSTASRTARFLLLFFFIIILILSFTHHFLFDLSRRLSSLLLYRITLISVIPRQLSGIDSCTHMCNNLAQTPGVEKKEAGQQMFARSSPTHTHTDTHLVLFF
jgi:hypothetical protein